MSSPSYITISAIRVLQAAEKYLERSKENRNARKEKIIDMYKQKRTWFGFGRQYTEEEARSIARDELGDNYFTGRYWEDRVKTIEKACRIARDGSIQLSVDDAALLKDFL